jgi:hypothetical protein
MTPIHTRIIRGQRKNAGIALKRKNTKRPRTATKTTPKVCYDNMKTHRIGSELLLKCWQQLQGVTPPRGKSSFQLHRKPELSSCGNARQAVPFWPCHSSFSCWPATLLRFLLQGALMLLQRDSCLRQRSQLVAGARVEWNVFQLVLQPAYTRSHQCDRLRRLAENTQLWYRVVSIRYALPLAHECSVHVGPRQPKGTGLRPLRQAGRPWYRSAQVPLSMPCQGCPCGEMLARGPPRTRSGCPVPHCARTAHRQPMGAPPPPQTDRRCWRSPCNQSALHCTLVADMGSTGAGEC